MTRQEILDIVAPALINQGCQSYSTSLNTCVYRGPNGTKCAVGHLIPDEIYNDDMEGLNVKSLSGIDGVPEYFRDNKILKFLSDLQMLHDDIDSWHNIRKSLKKFAKNRKLKVNF
jgi:hypothetical protein